MSARENDDVRSSVSVSQEEQPTPESLELYYDHPKVEKQNFNLVITTDNPRLKKSKKQSTLENDGLYSSDTPLTRRVVKPYPLELQNAFCRSEPEFKGKLLEIAIREVKFYQNEGSRITTPPDIRSVTILFKGKVICKANKPFNRKLHKMLIRNQTDSSNLSIQVNAQGGIYSILPFPLPNRNVREKRLEIDFSLTDTANIIFSGIVIYTLTVVIRGLPSQSQETSVYLSSSNDPNDPRNSVMPFRSNSRNEASKKVKYFLLHDPALTIPVPSREIVKIPPKKETKSPDLVVAEQTFSIFDFISKSWFQIRRPLRPTIKVVTPKHHAGRKQTLMVNVLKGVEIPVREESALVQPLIEIEWGEFVRSTEAADGPAPIWMQTIKFEVPRVIGEQHIKLRLFDQHPVWGLQWLGEARIPIEYHRNYQDFERWVGLSPVYSPVVSFGYVQAGPGYSHSKIYIMTKLEEMGVSANPVNRNTIDNLSKSIQKCLSVPYKISEVERPEEIARVVTLLSTLPVHRGPILPRQALNTNSVDHYGRSALLTSLLQGLGFQAFVLIASSQVRKWTAYTITCDEESDVILWDPENGDYFDLKDSRCGLIKVYRMINHQNVWENTQRAIPPANIGYDPKTNRNWRVVSRSASKSGDRVAQTVELVDARDEEDPEAIREIEELLKEHITRLRSEMELSTDFNQHAEPLLREVLTRVEESSKYRLDKKELQPLFRSYYVHGFVLNLPYNDFDELTAFLTATKIHAISGPVEFTVVCRIKTYIGKIRSILLAVVVLRNRS